MYGLAQYLRFDCGAFLRDKVLTVTSCGPLKDYETKQVTGTKVITVITEDKTPYKPKADGTAICNRYEKISCRTGQPCGHRVRGISQSVIYHRR